MNTTRPDGHSAGDVLLLHMPALMASSAADSPIMLSAATAAYPAGLQHLAAAAATSSATAESQEAARTDAAAGQHPQLQGCGPGGVQEAVLAQLKKACKPGKVPPKKKPGHKKQQMVCKVDGCGTHLGAAKAYYQRHKVCAVHLSAMVCPVNGVECRFCQQCGKFQPLSEFDADKRSCRARLKRHNNRRREQRHNKSYEFALELRTNASAGHMLGGMEGGDQTCHLNPFYAAAAAAGGLQPAAFGSRAFTAQYQPHPYGLGAVFAPADTCATAVPNVAVAAAAAAALVASNQEQQQQQQQQQVLGGLLSRWVRMECASTISPKQEQATAGDGSGMAGSGAGHSEATAIAAPGQHSSPGTSPSAAAVAAAAAAATAAAGATGTPTSRQPSAVHRVSAHKALDALRATNVSSLPTQSTEWDEESEDGDGRSPPTGTSWQHHHQHRRQLHLGPVGAGISRLQAGSRLRASDGMVAYDHSSCGGSTTDASAQHHVVPHMLPPPSSMTEGATPRASHAAAVAAFNGGRLSHLNPASGVQQGQWGGAESEGQGWDSSFAHQLHEQRQQGHWGSAYDSSCGGAGSGGGASYDNTFAAANQRQHHVPQQHQGGLSMQHSAPPGICISRSNSPAISAGPGSATAAAAAGMGPSMLGPGVVVLGSALGYMPASALQHSWSFPAAAQHGASAHEYNGGGSYEGDDGTPCHADHHGMPGQGPAQQQHHFQQDSSIVPAGGLTEEQLRNMQPHELQRLLEGLLPAQCIRPYPPQGPGCADGAGAPMQQGSELQHFMQHHDGGCAPDPQHMQQHDPQHMQQQGGFNPMDMMLGSMPEGGSSQGAAAFMQQDRSLSPQASMTAAAAAAAAAAVASGGSMVGPSCMPLQQQQYVGGDMEFEERAALAAAADAAVAAAVAAGQHEASNSPPGAACGPHNGGVFGSFGGAPCNNSLGQPGPAGMCSHLQQQGGDTDSQGGSSMLRGELEGIHLAPNHWQHQQQPADTPMPGGQYVKHPGSLLAEHDDMAALADAMDDEEEQHLQRTLEQFAPDDFDCVDTAAAAATFQAQLAACDGDKESQEAVFKAWLDALMPQGAQQDEQEQQQQPQQSAPDTCQQHQEGQQLAPRLEHQQSQQQPQQFEQGGPSAQQPNRNAAGCLQHTQTNMGAAQLQEDLADLGMGMNIDNMPPSHSHHQELQQQLQEHLQAPLEEPQGPTEPSDFPGSNECDFGVAVDDDACDGVLDVDAAVAAALQMAMQRASEDGVQGAGAGAGADGAFNPEEDFRELLDLLIDP